MGFQDPGLNCLKNNAKKVRSAQEGDTVAF